MYFLSSFSADQSVLKGLIIITSLLEIRKCVPAAFGCNGDGFSYGYGLCMFLVKFSYVFRRADTP